MLARIQNDLFDLGADLCRPGDDAAGALRVHEPQVLRLEREIDAMNERLQPLRSFVLPGGTPAAAYLHLARTVTRRAERLTVELAEAETVNPAADPLSQPPLRPPVRAVPGAQRPGRRRRPVGAGRQSVGPMLLADGTDEPVRPSVDKRCDRLLCVLCVAQCGPRCRATHAPGKIGHKVRR